MTRKAEAYFEWLCHQITPDYAHRNRRYTDLYRILHSREFADGQIIPNDENRIADAMDLRKEFWGEGRTLPLIGVSILEVIVALSRRLEFQADDLNKEAWAWQLIRNLKLHRCWDPLTRRREQLTHIVIDRLITRTYNNDGDGGFFPLKAPETDQRQVEIWYQMNAYLNEQFVT